MTLTNEQANILNCSMPQIGCIGLYGKKSNQVDLTLGGISARKQYFGQEIQGLYSLEEAIDLIEKSNSLL